jgi:hypothetical protein
MRLAISSPVIFRSILPARIICPSNAKVSRLYREYFFADFCSLTWVLRHFW